MWVGGVVRERSQLYEKRDQDKNQKKKTHNRENPKEMLESRKHNSTDPEPIFPKKPSLICLPSYTKTESEKIFKKQTPALTHPGKQASERNVFEKKRLWDKTGSRGEGERNGC